MPFGLRKKSTPEPPRSRSSTGLLLQPPSYPRAGALVLPLPLPPLPALPNEPRDGSLQLPKLKTRDLSSSEVSSGYDSSPGTSPNPNSRVYPDSRAFSPGKMPSRVLSNDNASTVSGRRTLSEKAKATPASLVRQLRIYSNSTLPDGLDNSDPSVNMVLRSNSLLNQNKLVSESLPPELSPVVNLINAQKLRTYAVGTFHIPGISAEGDRGWVEVEAKLTGSELAIWRPSSDDFHLENDEFKPKYINLVDCNMVLSAPGVLDGRSKLSSLEIHLLQDFGDNSTVIRLHNEAELHRWVAAIELAKFEYTSLNESFTAVMLSLKGPQLSDIHILLTPKKRYAKYDWCNLRLPQVSSKWLKVYVAIIPSDSKKIGRIEMYTSDKISKKNLVLIVPNLSSVYNVYPEQTNMIDVNSLMKLNGEIYVSKAYEHLFVHTEAEPSHHRSLSFKSHSRAGSSSSLSSLGNTPVHANGHGRSTSITSTSSFFANAPSPLPDTEAFPSVGVSRKDSTGPGSPGRERLSSSVLKKLNLVNFVSTNYLYLMPIPHPGVPPLETMLRNFLYVIDAFKLYGRPSQLISVKTNPESLLFGLPSLPFFEYLSSEDAHAVVSQHFNVARQDNWNEFDWRNAFKMALVQKYGSTDKNAHNYKGAGNIFDLYNSLEEESAEIEALETATIGSPKISLPAVANMDDELLSPIPKNDGPNGSGEFETFSDTFGLDYNAGFDEEYKGTGEGLGAPIAFEGESNMVPKSYGLLSQPPVERFDVHDRSLEPIADMPTPIEELHPYQKLVDLNLKE